MVYVGAIIIGVLTSVAGLPAWGANGVNWKNLFVVVLASLLWLINYFMIQKSKR